MKIVVDCTCQVPYEFEVDPVDGKMPGPVYCPTCGADGTEYANWVIEQQVQRAQAHHRPKIALKRGPLSDQPVESATATTAQETPDASGAGPSVLPQHCYIHAREPMAAFCFTCKKPICKQCMKHFGYFCSPYCRGRAEDQGLEIPEYEGQERIQRVKEYRAAKMLVLGAVLGLLALVGAYEWYAIVGQKPSVRFTMSTTEGGGVLHAQFVGDTELLLLSPDTMQVYDFKKKQPVWSKSLAAYRAAGQPGGLPGLLGDKRAVAAAVQQLQKATPEQIAQAQQQMQYLSPKQLAEQGLPADAAQEFQNLSPEEVRDLMMEQMATFEDYYDSGPAIHMEGNNLWLTTGNHIVCFDRETGAEKAKAEVRGRIRDMTFGENALVVVSSIGSLDRVFTRVELPSGKQETESRTLPPPPKRPERPFSGDMDWVDPDALAQEDPWIPEDQHAFYAAGPTVAQLDVKLLEKKFITVDTMKPTSPELQKKFDEDLKVTDTAEYAADVMGEMARMKGAGTAKIDESRYSITIGRVFGKDAAPWTTEVVGPPAFYALKTVDVLVAGKKMYVFNRDNQKIWESNLAYPIDVVPASLSDALGDAAAAVPCVERGDTLYLYDPGMLTAYETKSGNVRWRLPNVGISKLQFDDRGMMYISTTSASPESIQYSQQISFTDKPVPVIVKLDPATGKVLWSIEKKGDACFPSGKYLYIAKSRTGMSPLAAMMATGGETPSRFRLMRLNPANGKLIWEYDRPDMPGIMDFRNNQILFQYQDKLEVLKFLSF